MCRGRCTRLAESYPARFQAGQCEDAVRRIRRYLVPHVVAQSPSSLLVGTLFIDVATARNLELVKNVLTRRNNNTLYGKEFLSSKSVPRR